MSDFICEICQRAYKYEKDFLQHLNTHSKAEVEKLREIALKKLDMSPEEEKAYNLELAIKGLSLS